MKPGILRQIARVEHRLIEDDRPLARALRGEHRVVGFEMADPSGLRLRRRREPAGGEDVGRSRQQLQVLETIAIGRRVPSDVPRRLVDEERLVIRIVELEIARAQAETSLQSLNRRIGRQARLDLERNRHVRFKGRALRVDEEHIVETEIARGQGHHAGLAAARRRIDRPASRAAARRGVDRRRVRALVKGQREIVVDGLLAERRVLDLEMAMRETDAVQRLTRSGHRVDDPERDEAEIGRRGGRGRFGRGGRGQFDGRRGRNPPRPRSKGRRRGASAIADRDRRVRACGL